MSSEEEEAELQEQEAAAGVNSVWMLQALMTTSSVEEVEEEKGTKGF